MDYCSVKFTGAQLVMMSAAAQRKGRCLAGIMFSLPRHSPGTTLRYARRIVRYAPAHAALKLMRKLLKKYVMAAAANARNARVRKLTTRRGVELASASPCEAIAAR